MQEVFRFHMTPLLMVPLCLGACAMNTTGSEIAERQFITKELADTLAGKTPAPYLRVHDSAQIGTFRSLFPHFRFFIPPALT
jgi:hypothetical protein